jgi:hypothetical protein
MLESDYQAFENPGLIGFHSKYSKPKGSDSIESLSRHYNFHSSLTLLVIVVLGHLTHQGSKGAFLSLTGGLGQLVQVELLTALVGDKSP